MEKCIENKSNLINSFKFIRKEIKSLICMPNITKLEINDGFVIEKDQEDKKYRLLWINFSVLGINYICSFNYKSYVSENIFLNDFSIVNKHKYSLLSFLNICDGAASSSSLGSEITNYLRSE